MDEERRSTPVSPGPAEDENAGLDASNSHKDSNSKREDGSLDPKPSGSEELTPTYTEPLILRVNGTLATLHVDDGEDCKNNINISQTELSTPDKSIITSPPAARSTPIHPTQPCRSQPNSQLRNGAKSLEHVHCPHTHCLNHTPHAFKSNPVRNGGSHRHPKLGSLPRGGSSTSSSSSAGPKYSRKLQSNPSITSQSSKRSKSSSKSNGSQIPTEAQDDCCVHCILACLFCEFLTLCNIMLDCATCGSCAGEDSCFCCCCASEECGDCDLPCDMDCGIIDACCESADCLEICMECCSLCFSS
uniref:MyoD family inhibitor domain-containing protein n=1 Tax=Oryzias latipes TaxID=8090 RepID=A0A3P9L039_ORYLA